MSAPAAPPPWTLYLLVSASGRTYAGITTDLARRLAQHNGAAPGGARATRAGRPWALAASWGPYPDRAAASRDERRLKALRGPARAAFSPAELAPPAPRTPG